MTKLDKSPQSSAWTEADIAAKQRAIVDAQLEDMRAGVPPRHFEVMRDVMGAILAYPETMPMLSLLDAGCASAYYHEIIKHYHPGRFAYTGLDFNAALLDMAKRLYPDITAIKADLRHTGLPDKPYDVVLSGAALMHIRDWRNALSELTRLARRWLALHRTWVVDGETVIQIGDAYGHPAWYIRFEEAELMELVQNSGFELVKTWDDVESGSACRVNTYLFKRTE